MVENIPRISRSKLFRNFPGEKVKEEKEKRKKEIRLEFRDRDIENLRWPSLYKSRLISSNGKKKKDSIFGFKL